MAESNSSSAGIVSELAEGKTNLLENVISSIRGSDGTFREKFEFLLKILTLCVKVKVKRTLLKKILGFWGDLAILPRLLSVISTPDTIINYVLGTMDVSSSTILSTMITDNSFRPGDFALVTNRLEYLKDDGRSKEFRGVIPYSDWANLHQYTHAGIINAMNIKDEEKRDEDAIEYLQSILIYIQGRLTEIGSIMIPPWVFRNNTDYLSSTDLTSASSSSSSASSSSVSSSSATTEVVRTIDPKSIAAFPYITDDVYARVKQIMEGNLRLAKKVDAVKTFVMTAPKWEIDNLLKSRVPTHGTTLCTHSSQCSQSSSSQSSTSTKECSCHHDDIVENTTISPSEMLSLRYWGPVNNTIGYSCNLSPSKDGTCHMLTCGCHEESDDNWFTGSCDNCDCKIGDISHAVRFPHPDGGWVGCYHSFACMQEHLDDNIDKEDIMRLDRFGEIIDTYGIYNRYDGKDKVRKWSGEPVQIYEIPD